MSSTILLAAQKQAKDECNHGVKEAMDAALQGIHEKDTI